MSEKHLFQTRDALDAELAAHIAERLRADIARRNVASLAVSGGSTPQGLFARLSQLPLDWARVSVSLVDERWVDSNSTDSNEALVRDTLLRNAAAAAQFIGMKTHHSCATHALSTVEERLANMPLPFTCVVLGMGSDGHTASWFPRASNLTALLDPAASARVATCDPVTAPHMRMTLTLPMVLAAGEIIVHITGEEKWAVLQQAADQGLPIAAVTAQQLNPAHIWWAP